MKKLTMLLMFVLTLAFVMPEASAQNRQLEKARKKEYKAKKKEFKKGGWQIYGTTRSLDVALLTHYDQLNALGDKAFEVMGVAPRFKSKNVGKNEAMNNAAILYAQQAGKTVKGRIVSDMASNGVDPSEEFDHFYAAYESTVEKEIKGELKESFTIIRELGNGEYEMQTFFIVNEDAATQARIRAYENALKESAAAQKYAEKVSEFVREGFPVEAAE